MGLSGLEPPTSRLSGVRSNQLSYKPALYNTGGHLLSRTVSGAVPSADRVLTVVFGMGTGVAPDRIAARFSGPPGTARLPPFDSASLHLIGVSRNIHLCCHPFR